MTPNQTFPEFKRNAVRPVECLSQGWELIKNQYWLFVGMSVVGMLIGGAVPLGILMGPMMCGVYLALLKTEAREPVEFATLFKGFDYFVDGMLAGILHAVPVAAVIVTFYVFMFAGQIALAVSGNHGEADPTVAVGFLGIFVIWLPIMMILMIILSIGFAFAYPYEPDITRASEFKKAENQAREAGLGFWSACKIGHTLSGRKETNAL